MTLPNLPVIYDVPESLPMTEVLNGAIEKWCEINLTTLGNVKQNTRDVDIYLSGKKTGHYVTVSNETEFQGNTYYTIRHAIIATK